MPYEPALDPVDERRARITRWASFAFAALLVILVTYFGYVAYEGSRQLAGHPAPTTDCRTPAAFGWAYEAVNYDIAGDAALADEPDPTACTGRGAAAGDEVGDDVGLAGWYIPAADGSGPTGPTVVLAHGWGSNKSTMLERAVFLHERYNLLLFDFRNHGQSGAAQTTQGVREARDLVAMLDWLEAAKGPDRVAVLGASMGGASAVAAAGRDDRIDALVVDSTHAALANAAEARLEQGGYPLAMPGSWAILLGALIRTGEDVSSVDPIGGVRRLDGRPLLLIYGSDDAAIGATDAADLAAAATEAGSPTELHTCADAGHDEAVGACPEAYVAWVLGFLERHLLPPA